MKKETRELLEQVIENRLQAALKGENEQAFMEAMEAIDRQHKIDQMENEIRKEQEKHNFNKEIESLKHNFDMEKEDKKQEFEFDKEGKRQNFELEKEVMKNNAENKRAADNREHEIKMENLKQNFREKELENQTKLEKMKMRLENDKALQDRLIRCGEIALAAVVTPMIEAGFKKAFAAMICDFEKDYNFTTIAGKSLNNLFRK